MYHIIFSFIFHKIFLSVAQSDFHPVTLCLEVCVGRGDEGGVGAGHEVGVVFLAALRRRPKQ